jgi:uncharacterized protein YdaU (DUF1376 family)
MSAHGRPDSFMPLYVGDWDGDTGHLDCEQDGAYGRIVRWYWRNGPPADDDAALARIVRMDLARWSRVVRPVVVAFFEVRDGHLHHARVEAELRKAERRYERAVAAAARRWRGRAPGNAAGNAPGNAPSNADPHAQTMLGRCQPQPHRKGREPKSSLPIPTRGRAPAQVDAAPARAEPMAMPTWPGPPRIRDALAAVKGESWCAAWLDPCEWDEDAEAILAPRGLTVDRLMQEGRRYFAAAGVKSVRVKGQPA